MTSITDAIEEFPRTLEKYSTRTYEKDVQKVVEDIGRVKNLNPPVYNERGIGEFLRGRATHLKQLVDDYFVKSMSHEFPLIDDNLFGLKRQLTLARQKGGKYAVVKDEVGEDKEDPKKAKDKNSNVKKVVLPLFAYTPLFEGEHKAKLGKFTKSRYDPSFGYTQRTTISIESRLPGSIGPNLKDAYRHAMQHYFSTMAEMFTNPVAADIMYAEGQFTKPQIGAIWIPTPESLSVTVTEKIIQPKKNIDPAMVITARGNKYLVQTWSVDGEEPFEHYIREFTTGSLKGKLR